MRELWALLIHLRFNNLFRTPTNNPFVQFFRYLFVGGIATITDWCAFYIIDKLNPEWLYFSTAVSFIAGLSVNYILARHFVFTESSIDSKFAEFIIYLITGLAGLGLTELLMFILAGKLGIHRMSAKVIATAAVFLWNFGSKKILLYRKRK